MIMTDQGYESHSDEKIVGIYDDMTALEGGELKDEKVEELDKCEGRLLVTMRALSIHSTHEEEIRRQNIFHAKCQINKNICLMIIDGGSCTNVVSTLLVEKNRLPTIPHSHPYHLQWFSDKGEVKVNSQT